jgi:superfamily II DNA or RNA helicase
MLRLRPYQQDALDAILTDEKEGLRRVLLAHATGLGKTVTFCHFLAKRDHRSLVLVHRDELVQQTIAKLSVIAPELNVGVVKAERNETNAGLIVASVQTLNSMSRLEQMPSDIGTVVVDEAHHAAANSYERVLNHLGALGKSTQVFTLGATATPERADGRSLSMWQKISHEMSILRGILDGYLVDVRAQTIGTDTELDRVRTSHGDFVQRQLGEELKRSNALSDAADGYVKYAYDRQGIAFTPTVDTAYQLSNELNAHGIRAAPIDGKMDLGRRRERLAQLRSGELQVITNCAVLTEGFDEPSVSAILLVRPTKSHPLFVQMIGRGTRPYPGKEDLLVLDVTGATERHDLISIADIAGTTPKPNEKLSETAERAEEERGEREQRELTRARKTRAVDLFRSRMRWLPAKPGFCLPLGGSLIVLVPSSLESWSVVQKTGKEVTTLYSDLPLGYAQGVGEDLARSAGSVAKRDAWWGRSDPSAAQLNRLRVYGLSEHYIEQIQTRGQASDLITRIEARKVIRRMTK